MTWRPANDSMIVGVVSVTVVCWGVVVFILSFLGDPPEARYNFCMIDRQGFVVAGRTTTSPDQQKDTWQPHAIAADGSGKCTPNGSRFAKGTFAPRLDRFQEADGRLRVDCQSPDILCDDEEA